MKEEKLKMKNKAICFILLMVTTISVFGEEERIFGDRIEDFNGFVYKDFICRFQNDFTIKGKYKKKNIQIMKYIGTKTDVIIPKKINGFPVTSIYTNAFGNFQSKYLVLDKMPFVPLTSIIIPNGIKEIGDTAFKGNYLTNVIIPNSVERIESNAFLQNQLKGHKEPFSIMIYKKKITIIGYNHDEKDIVIPEKINELPVIAIGEWAFIGYNLISIIIPDTVKIIGIGAFANNRLTNVIIPESVEIIDMYAFSNNRLTNVIIPNSIKIINRGVFQHNQLTIITIPNSIELIESEAFKDNNLTITIIPNSITKIKHDAFDQEVIIIYPKDIQKFFLFWGI